MELPENLQMIKTEQTSPLPLEKSPNNIKERLNLHLLKRRNLTMQLEPQHTPPCAPDIRIDTASKQQQKLQKTRRPYQKRTDKVNTNQTPPGPVRKYRRHKVKSLGSAAAEISSLHSDESGATLCAGNGEEDGFDGLEAEAKSISGRDKDKCPDVLAMVLSVKKRALMNDPEVKQFLSKVMNAIKS